MLDAPRRDHLARTDLGSPFPRRQALVIPVTSPPLAGVAVQHGFPAYATLQPSLQHRGTAPAYAAGGCSFLPFEQFIGPGPDRPVHDRFLLARIDLPFVSHLADI